MLTRCWTLCVTIRDSQSIYGALVFVNSKPFGTRLFPWGQPQITTILVSLWRQKLWQEIIGPMVNPSLTALSHSELGCPCLPWILCLMHISSDPSPALVSLR